LDGTDVPDYKDQGLVVYVSVHGDQVVDKEAPILHQPDDQDRSALCLNV
jgi:hypothetical protein